MKEEVAMTRSVAVVVALVALTAGVSCAEPPKVTPYSKLEIKAMLRNAHSAQQYQELAAYFRARQSAFKQEAQSAKQEWERRGQITAGVYQKYPRPADSSKDRYEYFTYEAGQMGLQAAHFENLSTTAQQ